MLQFSQSTAEKKVWHDVVLLLTEKCFHSKQGKDSIISKSVAIFIKRNHGKVPKQTKFISLEFVVLKAIFFVQVGNLSFAGCMFTRDEETALTCAMWNVKALWLRNCRVCEIAELNTIITLRCG